MIRGRIYHRRLVYALPVRDRLVFTAGLVALWLFFVVMASLTPVQLDDWYQVAWHDQHDFTPANVFEFARYNYFNYNPRPGETLLLIVNSPTIAHLVITPVFEVALLLVVYVLAFGRAPRASLRTLAELAIVQALIWLCIPTPGPMYFYRPYTTNYLFASCVQFALFIPFRLELSRAEPGPARGWLAPVLLVWAVLAGMTNEHTGPTAIVVALGLTYVAHRRSRLRPWMACAVIGLIVGYALIYFAPGQTLRYAGLSTEISPLKTIRSRGAAGAFRILYLVIGEAQLGLALVAGAAVVARRRVRTVAAALDGVTVATVVVAIAGALMIMATIMASPIIEDRVLFAPCLLITIALCATTVVPWQEPRVRAAMIAIASAVVVYHGAKFIVVYRVLDAESDARLAALRRAAPGEVVNVVPSRWFRRDRWVYGEDLRWSYMREFIAHRVFDVGGLELTPLPALAQPTPPERARVAVRFEPPLDARAARPDWPLWRFVPTQWPWVVRDIRESLATFDTVPGHTLREIDVTVEPATPGLPAGKPIYLVRWRDGEYFRVDGRPSKGRPFLRITDPRLPLDPTEAWVSACGTTRPAGIDRIGSDIRLPYVHHCPGNHTLYVCDASVCWLAGRYW